MKVIRMQNADGRGPYTAFFSSPRGDYLTFWEAWANGRHDDDKHPGIYEDKGLRMAARKSIPRGIKFGFETIEKAKAWFSPDEIRTLKEYGFKFVELECDKVWHGDKQSVFVPLDNS